MSRLDPVDWAIIVCYFAVIIAVAFWPAGKGPRKKGAEQYFLASRDVGWFVIGASIFASNIGAEHLIGLAGSGAAGNMPAAQFEIIASFALLILGWLFIPFYWRSGVYTMPEFLERRYSAGPRYYLAILSVIGYVLTKISVTIAAGGIVFETLMGVSFWTGAIVVVVGTGVYTVLGGLRAVLYTDLAQMFLIIGGSLIITIVGLREIGGWSELRSSVEPGMFQLWRSAHDPEFPWTGVLFGVPILGIWYWCTDQFIVQRALSGRSIEIARQGTIFAAYLKQLPLFLFVVPGIIAFVLLQEGVLYYERADQALPALIGTLLPSGLKGLVVAGFLAALMSSLSSVFNSCSTIVTMDLYRRVAPDASERRLVVVGQLVTALIVCVSLAWIPLMGIISDSLYTYLQSVQSYISPPIAAVFLVGVLWSGANAAGAMAALLAGLVIGMARLLLEMNKGSLSGFWLAFVEVNYLHFAVALFCVSTLIIVIFGLVMKPARRAATADLILWSRPAGGKGGRSTQVSVAFSAGVVLVAFAIWIYFS